jgi:hypothetical protein
MTDMSVTGAAGIQGTTGAQGSQGTTGLQGTFGAQGNQGPTGSQGSQGNQGPTGLQGTTGAQGNQGPTGLQGTIGIQGTVGAQGNQGPIGNTGLQGIIGAQGPTGFQGNTGGTGAQGSQGPTGAQGNQGPTGFQGNTGDGAQWHNGTGDPVSGPSDILGDYYLDNGTNNVWYYDGATWMLVTNIKGSTGSQGVQGPTGPQGFTGQQGRQGPTGITGNQGDTGAQGNQGPIGVQGSQGNQGPTGITGVQGNTGSQGNQGPIGIQGTQGTNGSNGAQGNQGPTGFQGNQGNQGPIGIQGFNGTSGTQGNQGPTGPQGIDGTQGATGTGFSITYNQILYVDPNGNDATAVLGDPTNPWETVEAAFAHCITESITRYEIFVNPGIYAMSAPSPIEITGTAALNLSPNATINATGGTTSCIFQTNSGCDFKINGGGRSQSKIYVNGRGLIQGTDGSGVLISLNDVYVKVDCSQSMFMDGVVVEVVYADLRIDNCYLELFSTAGGWSSVIRLINGTIMSKSSTLKLNHQGYDFQQVPELGGGYAALRSWVIRETQNGTVKHRIMLHQTSMVIVQGGGFILTAPPSATQDRSILLDSVYMHSPTGNHLTLWNDNIGATDNYYVGSQCISGGDLPGGNWIQLPPDSMVPNIITFQMPTITPY